MAETGRAAVFVGPEKPFDIPIPLPTLEPGSILAKIGMSNICGSDLHIYRGDMAKSGFDGSREAILGHEMSGRVYALGEGVTTDSLGKPIKAGDRIAYRYFQPCWSCPAAATSRSARRSASPSGWARVRTASCARRSHPRRQAQHDFHGSTSSP